MYDRRMNALSDKGGCQTTGGMPNRWNAVMSKNGGRPAQGEPRRVKEPRRPRPRVGESAFPEEPTCANLELRNDDVNTPVFRTQVWSQLIWLDEPATVRPVRSHRSRNPLAGGFRQSVPRLL